MQHSLPRTCVSHFCSVMSCKQSSEGNEPGNECSLGGEQGLIATNNDDPRSDTSGSEDEAHDIMVLALRSQIREALHEEHQQEIAKVKQTYESELQELRADITTLQQFEAKQLERTQVGGSSVLDCWY